MFRVVDSGFLCTPAVCFDVRLSEYELKDKYKQNTIQRYGLIFVSHWLHVTCYMCVELK